MTDAAGRNAGSTHSASGHGEAVYELFEWLRGLSFVDVRKEALPHDLAGGCPGRRSEVAQPGLVR